MLAETPSDIIFSLISVDQYLDDFLVILAQNSRRPAILFYHPRLSHPISFFPHSSRRDLQSHLLYQLGQYINEGYIDYFTSVGLSVV